ncbi:MAG: hypothetical protein JO077_07500 [Verrucomicrobia bacterium]|nr:hypothetical protein [Verrucomicrobiota bacterium]
MLLSASNSLNLCNLWFIPISVFRIILIPGFESTVQRRILQISIASAMPHGPFIDGRLRVLRR